MKKIVNKIKSGYDNLMNGTKLGYYLRKSVSTKNAYLMLIVFSSLFLLGAYVSYAFFTVAKEKDKAFKIVVGNLVSNISSEQLDSNHAITVGASSSRSATIVIRNTNSVKAKYNLGYKVYDSNNNLVNDSVSVKYVEVSKDKPNGSGQYVIDEASSNANEKVVQVMIINGTTTDKKVVFSSQVGLSTATLVNNTNVNLVKEKFKYTYDDYASSLSAISYQEGDTNTSEFKIAYKSEDSNSLYARVSKDKVYMDVSETLDSQDVKVAYKSAYTSGVSIEHPQSTASLLKNGTIFGQSGLVNIGDYFTFTSPTSKIVASTSFDYNTNLGASYPFQLIGSIKDQTKTVNGVDVTLGFSGMYNDTDSTYDDTKFSVLTNDKYVMPSFTLYTYNKTSFKSEIEKLKKKVYEYDPYTYDVEGYINKINDAISNYYNKRKVTQEQLDKVLTVLKKGPTAKSTLLTLDDFQDGFVNMTTGVVESNSTYPNSIYSKLVTLRSGKTYTLTNDSDGTKELLRIRLYNTDESYIGNLNTTGSTAYVTSTSDVSNLFLAKTLTITPKQDLKVRIMYLDKSLLTKTELKETN